MMLGVKAKIIFTALCLSIWVVLVAVGDIIFEMTFTFGCSKNKYILKTNLPHVEKLMDRNVAVLQSC